MTRLTQAAAVCLALVLAWAPLVSAQYGEDRAASSQIKSLNGTVFSKEGKPLPDAMVYLKNLRSLAVKTFIADKEGKYQFNGLSPNVDYEVYAQYEEKRSGTKTVSSFDSRTKITLDLEIDLNK